VCPLETPGRLLNSAARRIPTTFRHQTARRSELVKASRYMLARWPALMRAFY